MYWTLTLGESNKVDVCAVFNHYWTLVESWAIVVDVCNRLDVCNKGGPIGRYHLYGSRITNVQLVAVYTRC